MLYLLVGDDTAESRNHFLRLKEEYRSKGYEIINLNEQNINELQKWLYQSQQLFTQKKAFFAENLLNKQTIKILSFYDNKNKEIDFILWEEKLEEKAAKKIFKNAKVLSFKLPYNIFRFLDSVYPSNLHSAYAYLTSVAKIVDENIILYMLQQRFRDLIIIKGGLKPKKNLADWQINRLKSQAEKWEEEKLISFYDALYRIEVNQKTGQAVYSIKKSLDILMCYYL